ncbi:SLATT domain-containing protein [Rhizobium leguminosarum bv. viciae]|uniref:SLATT domain-containing protein n=1 Tax=Rhizobium leguminosarum TaxID=384 RepID=UPI001441AC54|nr:SLATT domain-containing protein [Rhizobium leguminosarum]NKK36329.1 SLATT domain-containing protein [Rhizobium leguminosarum bv. viciae]NKL05606.1 SLATT domain-containing protein [Rhizobium leguminosarum bv. viciae]NKL33209.1 SLATT domain-containing protein [Rhizobium leguminosarum bv. viciae]
MNLDEQLKTKIASELQRLEEDCAHSGKAHFNASDRWNQFNYWFGIPSVVISAVVGTALLKDHVVWASVGSAAVTVLTALVTFLKPAEKATLHKSSGDQYLTLKNDSRVFREITLLRNVEEATALEGLEGLTKRRNELNQASPLFANRDFRKAKKGVDDGQATHVVDKVAR